jgi:hypothetical protein
MEKDRRRVDLDAAILSVTAKHGKVVAGCKGTGLLECCLQSQDALPLRAALAGAQTYPGSVPPNITPVAIFHTSFIHDPCEWNQVYRYVRGSSPCFCLLLMHYDCIDPSSSFADGRGTVASHV